MLVTSSASTIIDVLLLILAHTSLHRQQSLSLPPSFLSFKTSNSFINGVFYSPHQCSLLFHYKALLWRREEGLILDFPRSSFFCFGVFHSLIISLQLFPIWPNFSNRFPTFLEKLGGFRSIFNFSAIIWRGKIRYSLPLPNFTQNQQMMKMVTAGAIASSISLPLAMNSCGR